MDYRKIFLNIFFLCIVFVSSEDVKTIDVIGDNIKSKLILSPPSGKDATACSVILPDGTEIKDPANADLNDFNFESPCTLIPKTSWSLSLSGTYKLKLTYKNEDKSVELSAEYNVNWFHKTVPLSSRIFSDQLLTIYMLSPERQFPKIKSCTLSKLQEGSDDASASEKGIVEDGICKLPIKSVSVDKTDGFWQTIAITEKGHRLKALTEVTVIDIKELDIYKKHSMEINSISQIIRPKVDIAKILKCSLYDNNGKLVIRTFGVCEYHISGRKYHEGQWKAVLTLDGKTDIFEQVIDVKVTEERPIRPSCKNSKTGKEVHLLCKYKSSFDRTCLFVGPKGQTVSATEGIGKSKYSFYSTFEESSVYQHCGLTISERNKDDEGSWKCEVDTVGYVHILIESKGCALNTNTSEYTPTVLEKFYALNATKTSGLSCSINAELQYCFFRSPLGDETLGVTDEKTEGVCRMPEFTTFMGHSGKWECILAVSGQEKEYTKSFEVIVLTSWFQTSQSEFVYKKDTGAELKCINHVPVDNETFVCRFTRPDGLAINLDQDEEMEHYKSISDHPNGVCGLKLSTLKKEDYGQWTCSSLALNENKPKWFTDRFLLSTASIICNPLKIITVVKSV